MLVPALLLLAYLCTLVGPSDEYSFLADFVLGNAVLAAPAAVCLVRAVRVRAQRVAFALIGLAAAAFTAGNVAYVGYVQYVDPVPYPSVADIGYLAPYPLLAAAVFALASPELRNLPRGALLDGLIGALACAAVGAAFILRPLLGALEGGTFARVVGGAYPVADLSLAALIVAVLTLKGGRPGGTWLWLGSGVVVFAVADTLYLERVTAGTYQVGTLLDGLWAIGLNLMAIAAALPYTPGERPSPESSTRLVLPNVFSFAAVAVLIYGSLTRPLPVYVVILTSLTLLTAVQRIAVGFSSLRLLAETQRQARTDELTQLSNRRHFEEQVQHLLSARRPDERTALLIVDLDGFKQINDTLGHHAGDEMLRQIASRLRRSVRPGDVVARLGGDEFAVLLPDADRRTAMAVADQVVACLAEPYLLDGMVQSGSASIGIALCPDDGADLAVLLQHADLAMFDAKSRDAMVTVYDRERLGTGAERLNVREALARHELFVEYQPQFDRAGRMYGVEALVRWRHPERGPIPPARFLPLFEQADLMAELTLHVLDLGARDRRLWLLDGVELNLSVNLAPAALIHDDLIGSVGAVLARHGMPARALTLEITESMPVTASERSLRTLNELRAIGVRLSLDDYGTGWCSLSYLRDLPLDEVKIDRSFVMDLVPGSVDATVIASTVELAGRLGLSTVAEGVETVTALTTLRELGCENFQGYLLGRPVPAERIGAQQHPGWAEVTGATAPVLAARASTSSLRTPER